MIAAARAREPAAGQETARSRHPPVGPASEVRPARRVAATVPWLTLVATLLIAAGALSGARVGWLAAKATLAQHLLERSWRATRADGRPARPWPWADIVPLARLVVPAADTTLVVLQDASGEALAFGPGLVAGDPEHAADRPLALGGHRDSHLAFLEDLAIGASIRLEDRAGAQHVYRLASKRVLDSRDGPLSMPSDRPALVLITCWPFRATQTGGPLRLVAIAVPAAAEPDATTGVSTDPTRATASPPLYCRACATPPSSNASPPTAARAVPIRGRSTIAPSPVSRPART